MHFKLFQKLRFALALLIAAIATISVAQAQTEPRLMPPRVSDADVFLTWIQNNADEIDGFHVYIAEGQTQDLDDFTRLEDLEIQDTTLMAFTVVEDLPQGMYSFYVACVIDGEEGDASNIVHAQIRRQNVFIRFENEPISEATVDEEYVFDVDATASNDGEIEYSLNIAPDGMTIDSDTGEISWTPDEAGVFRVVVKAEIADDPSIFNVMDWVITVHQCSEDERPIFSGTVVDQDGDPLNSFYIVAYQFRDGTPYPFKTEGFQNGEFEMTLDAGSFDFGIFHGNRPLDFNDEDLPVTLACGDIFEMNIEAYLAPDIRIFVRSIPPDAAFVGEEYTYEPDAAASDTGDVDFELLDAPDGMTIDEETGEISWTPDEGGHFAYVRLKIYYEDDPNIHIVQTWRVYVHECERNNLAILSIEFQNMGGGNNFRAVNVFKAGENDSLFLFKELNSSGRYLQIPVDAGTYYVGAHSGRESQWYDGAELFEDADPIEIDCGDTASIAFSLGVSQRIYFTDTTLVNHVVIGDDYSETVTAETSDGSEVRYVLVEAPDGMTIDAETGEISWTPEVAGPYTVRVKAHIDGEPQAAAFLTWMIMVFECEDRPVISGTVLDQADRAIPRGIINVFKEYPDSDSVQYYGTYHFEQGEYEIELDKGTYYLQFVAGREGVWYENANSLENATPITIDCGEEFEANVVMFVDDPNFYYLIYGTVVADYGGDPIPYARVQFFAQRPNSDEIQTFNTFANAEGEYEILLSENFNYIAYAFAMQDSTGDGPEYIGMYYDQTDDAAEAIEIELTGDMEINFRLPYRPDYENWFEGTLVDENLAPIPNGFAIAFLVDAGPYDQEHLYVGRTARTDDEGFFRFINLIPGEYVVLALSWDRMSHIPGYYKFDAFAVRMWEEATRIPVYEEGDAGDIVVKLRNRQQFSGGGGMRGNCRRGGGTIKIGDAPAGADAIAGALVFAIDENDQVTDFDVTDHNGEFNLSGLPWGDYTVMANKVGYKTLTQTTEVDETTTSRDFTFSLDLEEDPSSVDETNLLETASVYPNPADGDIFLSFEAGAGTTRISILNSLGETALAWEIETNPGFNSINYDVKSLPAGAYYVKIQTPGGIKAVPLMIAR